MAAKQIDNVKDLIVALGGPKAAAEFLETTAQAVCNWQMRESMPSRLYFYHRRKLAEREIEAPAALWGMHQAEAAE